MPNEDDGRDPALDPDLDPTWEVTAAAARRDPDEKPPDPSAGA